MAVGKGGGEAAQPLAAPLAASTHPGHEVASPPGAPASRRALLRLTRVGVGCGAACNTHTEERGMVWWERSY